MSSRLPMSAAASEHGDALTTALARVLGRDAERAALVRRGLERAATFTAERTAGRVIDLLQETVGRRPALTGSAG